MTEKKPRKPRPAVTISMTKRRDGSTKIVAKSNGKVDLRKVFGK